MGMVTKSAFVVVKYIFTGIGTLFLFLLCYANPTSNPQNSDYRNAPDEYDQTEHLRKRDTLRMAKYQTFEEFTMRGV